jgi:O-antigen/teichoic acid export membrane protein
MEFNGIARALLQAFYTGLILVLVKSPGQLLAVPLIYLAAYSIASFFLLLLFVRHFDMPRFKFDFKLWKKLLSKALPMGSAFIMVRLYTYFDTVMLQFMRGEEEVGYYSAAYKIIFFFINLGLIYNQAIFPVVSRLFHTSIDDMRRLLSASTKLIVTIALPLAVGGTVLAQPIMRLLYSSQYDNGIIALQILIWVVTFMFIGSLYGYALIACGRQNYYARAEFTTVIANLVLNIILIPHYGLVGASAATLVSAGIRSFLMHHFFKQITIVPLQDYLLKPALACTGMAFFIYLFPNLNVILLVISGAVLYFFLLLILGYVTRNEIKMIWEQLVQVKESFGSPGKLM